MASREDRNIERIAVDHLEFDPQNPRLPERLKENGTESQILEWMLRDKGIRELMVSIGDYGYFEGEPLLVSRSPRSPQDYIVIEGNRRLAAVKLLLAPDLAPPRVRSTIRLISEEAINKPETIPCVVYGERDEILKYLGYRHVTGIKEWSALAKAIYLDQLFPATQQGSLDDKLRELARAIGSRKDYVAQLLTGLNIYRVIEQKDYFNIEGLNEESFRFAVLTTALSYSNLRSFLGIQSGMDIEISNLNVDNLQELIRWVYEKQNGNKPRVPESRQLSELNSIVGHSFALEQWRKGATLEVAYRLAELPEGREATELFRSAISDAGHKLSIAEGFLEDSDELLDVDVDTLTEVDRKATSLLDLVKVKLASQQRGKI